MKHGIANDEKGMALAEFGISLFFFILLVGGTFDWGMNIYISQLTENLAREGARIAAVQIDPNDPASKSDVIAAINRRFIDTSFSSMFTINTPNIVRQDSGRAIPLMGINPTLGIPEPCDDIVMVTVSVDYEFTLLKAFGMENFQTTRNASQRWQRQPMCNL